MFPSRSIVIKLNAHSIVDFIVLKCDMVFKNIVPKIFSIEYHKRLTYHFCKRIFSGRVPSWAAASFLRSPMVSSGLNSSEQLAVLRIHTCTSLELFFQDDHLKSLRSYCCLEEQQITDWFFFSLFQGQQFRLQRLPPWCNIHGYRWLPLCGASFTFIDPSDRCVNHLFVTTFVCYW